VDQPAQDLPTDLELGVGSDQDRLHAVQYSSANSARAVSLNLLAVTLIQHPSKLITYCFAPDVAINTVTMFAVRVAHSKAGALGKSF
jgi:hypothetical protein